jgi:chromosome segregation ATPase
VANYTISLIIDASNRAEGPLKNLGKSLDDLGQIGAMATGMLGELYSAGQKLFEFGKLGATVDQTSASFARLGIDLGELRSAANGTVSDMALMSSILTLTTGASGDLQQALVDNADNLLRIAKAASALNPAMGDTSYMFESLAIGVKRGSKLVIDNTGIIFDAAQANETYAQALGRTADSLTEDEKKMALLNATIETGNRIIEQNGGNVDSMTDGFTQLTAASTNLKNSLAQTASASGGFFGKLAQGVDGLSKFQQALNMAHDQGLNPLAANLEVLRDIAGANNTVFDEMRYTQETNRRETERMLALTGAYEAAYGKMETATAALTVTIDPATQAWLEYEEALQTAILPQRMLEEVIMADEQAVGWLREAMGGAVGNEMAAFRDAEGELIGKGEELRAKITELEQKRYLTDAQKEELAELRTQLGENNSAIDANVAKHEEATKRILFGFVEQRLGMDDLTEDELMALQTMAKNWGLLDDATYDAIVSIDSYADSVEAGNSTLDQMTSRVDGLSDRLLGLPRNVDINFNLVSHGAIPNIPGTNNSDRTPIAMQSGFSGIFTRPTAAIFGEGGPERVSAQPLNEVTNYNLSVTSQAAAASVVQDFGMMRAFAGR